ncbi:hypothetical protein T484DRAFT_1776701 [Baffinella frigidus]|nr:hypothetical protein T484DRAFT_1776701 [Cryptophyta sp. CCMP2293]
MYRILAYSTNDTITVQFSQPTTLAGFALNQVLTKQQVDTIFAFSVSAGASYTGSWTARDTFVITAGDVSTAGPPQISLFSLALRASAGLRNYPPQSGVCEMSSGFLTGDFGTIIPDIVSFIASGTAGAGDFGTIIPDIVSFVASGAAGADGKPDPGDTLTIVFWPPTNFARLPSKGITKAQIDAILSLSLSIGASYSGTSPNRNPIWGMG